MDRETAIEAVLARLSERAKRRIELEAKLVCGSGYLTEVLIGSQ